MAKASTSSPLDQLRSQIDSIDDRILDLLEERAGLAQAIGHEKRRASETQKSSQPPAYFDPAREAKVLKRLNSRSRAVFPPGSISFVYREIMSACRSLETQMAVAFLGPKGTYSELAASRGFGRSVEYLALPEIEDVFETVTRRRAQYGVVPLENSQAGGVTQTLDALIKTPLRIQSESYLPIVHCLLSRLPDRKKIKTLYSHPHAIAQCRGWILKNLPNTRTVACSSTAKAAELAAKEPLSAAIASRLAGERLKLRILEEGIGDQADNATRFVVLNESDGQPTGDDKTSILVSIKGEAASLGRVLDILKRHQLDVSRVETRPDAENRWNYLYFIDFAGHRLDVKVAQALSELGPCKILGSYPVGKSF